MEAIKVLLAEDVATDAELELRELKRAGLKVSPLVVDTEGAFRDAIASFRPDVILSDFSMPSFDGMSALAIAREACPDVPFIFVSGTLGEEYAIRALKNGAVDYVLKGNLLRLPSTVERAIQEARAEAERRRTETELNATRERLASIFHTLRDVLWSLDPASGDVLYVSPASEAVYGQPASAFLRDRDLWTKVIHPDDVPAVQQAWRALMNGSEFDCEYRILRPDGVVRWIHDRGRKVVSAGVERVDGVARDITEQAEQRLRIARLSSIREVLGAVNNAIVRIRDRDELLGEACRIAVELGGLKFARVALVDPATGEAQFTALRGEGSELFTSPELIERYGLDPVKGLLREALRQGEVVVFNDLAEQGRPFGRVLREHGVHSGAGFPLLVDGAIVGGLVLHAAEVGYFDQDEVRLLKEVTGNIAFALSLLHKQEELNYLAYYDPLTGLTNRAFFRSRLAEAIDAASRHGHGVGVLAFDIARFRAVNDALGQQAGDRLLQEFARRLKEAAGEEGRVSRLSADQFVMMIPSLKEASFVPRVLLERATAILDRSFVIEGRDLRISTRTGIAVFPADGADADALFLNAEAALAKSRASGERFTFYGPAMNQRFAERLEMENRLRLAMDRGELVLHYQPKVDTITRRVVGAEALMRWNDPEHGLVMPGKFIPILEETGLIVEAGRRAMRMAVEAQQRWRGMGLNVPRIAVNVSALQLREAGFVQEVRDLLFALPEGERALDIEITESVVMENMGEAIEKLKEVRALGVEISIDDFGTGYSSLAYINRLPIHVLKIDRSFVSGDADRSDAGSIVSAVIALARSLQLKTVAEGVETEEQARLLRVLECDQMQGYLLGKPMPGEQLEALLGRAAVVS
jgi:diguanylate cyclase (GGDEF)-like protein/PAS domain S-box-containing protein